ncbi:MAG: hypothetical protein U0168_14575 [Nannocystaceae bacterium]
MTTSLAGTTASGSSNTNFRSWSPMQPPQTQMIVAESTTDRAIVERQQAGPHVLDALDRGLQVVHPAALPSEELEHRELDDARALHRDLIGCALGEAEPQRIADRQQLRSRLGSGPR